MPTLTAQEKYGNPIHDCPFVGLQYFPQKSGPTLFCLQNGRKVCGLSNEICPFAFKDRPAVWEKCQKKLDQPEFEKKFPEGSLFNPRSLCPNNGQIVAGVDFPTWLRNHHSARKDKNR